MTTITIIALIGFGFMIGFIVGMVLISMLVAGHEYDKQAEKDYLNNEFDN